MLRTVTVNIKQRHKIARRRCVFPLDLRHGVDVTLDTGHLKCPGVFGSFNRLAHSIPVLGAIGVLSEDLYAVIVYRPVALVRFERQRNDFVVVGSYLVGGQGRMDVPQVVICIVLYCTDDPGLCLGGNPVPGPDPERDVLVRHGKGVKGVVRFQIVRMPFIVHPITSVTDCSQRDDRKLNGIARHGGFSYGHLVIVGRLNGDRMGCAQAHLALFCPCCAVNAFRRAVGIEIITGWFLVVFSVVFGDGSPVIESFDMQVCAIEQRSGDLYHTFPGQKEVAPVAAPVVIHDDGIPGKRYPALVVNAAAADADIVDDLAAVEMQGAPVIDAAAAGMGADDGRVAADFAAHQVQRAGILDTAADFRDAVISAAGDFADDAAVCYGQRAFIFDDIAVILHIDQAAAERMALQIQRGGHAGGYDQARFARSGGDIILHDDDAAGVERSLQFSPGGDFAR